MYFQNPFIMLYVNVSATGLYQNDEFTQYYIPCGILGRIRVFSIKHKFEFVQCILDILNLFNSVFGSYGRCERSTWNIQRSSWSAQEEEQSNRSLCLQKGQLYWIYSFTFSSKVYSDLSLFEPQAWKVCWGHLAIRSSVCPNSCT